MPPGPVPVAQPPLPLQLQAQPVAVAQAAAAQQQSPEAVTKHLETLRAATSAAEKALADAQAAMRRGWVGATDFTPSTRLEKDLQGVSDDKERRGLIRQERNRQSAYAARLRRAEYTAALEELKSALEDEHAFLASLL